MLCRIVMFCLTIGFSLTVPKFLANAQTPEDQSNASTNFRKTVSQAKATVKGPQGIAIEAEIVELQSQLLENPDDAISLNNLATNYVRLGRLSEALSIMKQSLGSDDKLAITHLNLGNLYDLLGRHDEALNAVSTSVRLDPLNPWSRNYLCELEVLTGRNSEAVRCYREYFSHFKPTQRSRSNFGVALMRAGELKESVAVLTKEASERPRETSVQNTLAIALYKSEDYESAIKVLKEAVENEPDLAELRLNLGICYLAVNNRPGALSQYRLLSTSNSKHAKVLYGYLFRKYLLDVRDPKEDRK